VLWNGTAPATTNRLKLHPCLTGGKLNVEKRTTVAQSESLLFLNVSTVLMPGKQKW